MKISINLTDEHIKLIKNLRYIKFDDNRYGVDNYAPWAYGGSSIFEDMALILGFGDKIIPETRESPFGAICEETTQRHLEELDAFLSTIWSISRKYYTKWSIMVALNRANIPALIMSVYGSMKDKRKCKGTLALYN